MKKQLTINGYEQYKKECKAHYEKLKNEKDLASQKCGGKSKGQCTNSNLLIGKQLTFQLF